MLPTELRACFDGYMKREDREYNRMADMAIMYRIAMNKKHLAKHNLYKPMGGKRSKKDTEEIKRRLTEQKKRWEQYDIDMQKGLLKQKDASEYKGWR